MSKERYEWYMGTSEIIDNKTKKFITQDCPELLNQQEKQIADLEAKLAEVKSSCDYYMKRSNDLVCEIGEYKKHIRFKRKEITELKQQLAEKEKEIENLKLCRCVNCTNEYEFMLEGLVEDLERELDKTDQDKISFAVAYLEIIKAFIIDKEFYFVGEDYSTVYVEDITEEIDNQIKQLKEMK